jgi:glucose 1-dehydrogenase
VLGHEALGVVESVGDFATGLRPGDLVTATVRRGCGCPPCAAGESDFCETLQYTERGIIGLHGFMTERYTERAEHLITVPPAIEAIGVLVEPTSVAEKVWRITVATQSRIRSWQPRTAVVFGAGPIGLLQTLLLRARGIDVYTLARTPAPHLASEIVAACGATYVSVLERSRDQLRADLPNVDLIVECSGSSVPVEQSLRLLGNNGVLVLLSITGGDRSSTLPLDRINFELVLGNKAVVGSANSSAADFRAAVADLQRFEELWPGLTSRLITQRLPNLEAALSFLESTKDDIKAVVELGG